MKRVRLRSSNIAEAGYEEETSTLEIRFHDGAEYRYFSVPVSVFAGLTAAASAGRYFHRQIKGRYRYRRIS